MGSERVDTTDQSDKINSPVETECGRSRLRTNLAVLGAAIGTFLAALDITIMGTAMPTIISILGGFEIYSWAFTSYFLASIVSTPIFGKLADMYSIRKIFLASVWVFIGASVLCGMSQNMYQLIAFRGLQGAGGGALIALCLTVIGAIYPPEKIGRMLGIMAAVWALAAVMGPIIGGLLVEKISWRWIFYINLPSGLVAAALVAAGLGKVRNRQHGKPDYIGGVTLLCGVLALLLVAGQGETRPFSPLDACLLVIGVFCIVVFIWNESRTEEPILPLSLFRIKTFSMCNALGFFAGAATFSVSAYLPLFYQTVIKSSALRAGAVLMPLSIFWGVASAGGVNLLLGRVSHHKLLALGFGFMVSAYAILSQIDAGTSAWVLYLSTSILGIGLGFAAPMILTLIQTSVSKRNLGVATSSAMFFRQLGGAVIISSLGGVMSRGLTKRLAALGKDPAYREVAQAITNPRDLIRPEVMERFPTETVDMLKGMFAESFTSIFRIALIIVGIGLVLSIIFVSMSRKTDSENEGRQG
ncbi:MAG: MFS transporter [Deltaproteobacteria bacterium]|nr:MFS transporter [Deltaproteobacteria bacterium]